MYGTSVTELVYYFCWRGTGFVMNRLFYRSAEQTMAARDDDIAADAKRPNRTNLGRTG